MFELVVFGIFAIFILLGIFRSVSLTIRDRKRRNRIRSLVATYLEIRKAKGRGTKSERALVLSLLKSEVPPITIFHDLYVKRLNGTYSQIDVLLLTEVGIVVFEVKDYSGWIFGSGYNEKWTQILSSGNEKHRFYNPIKQNRGHIEALKQSLTYCANVPFYSVIVFYGTSELREISSIPHNTWVVRPSQVPTVINMILKSNPKATYTDRMELLRILQKAVDRGNDRDVIEKHMEYVSCVTNWYRGTN